MNKEDLIKTARLARLSLSEKEKDAFTDQLQLVFEYFNKVSSINTQGVEPLVYPLDGLGELPAFVRQDEIQKAQNREDLLSLAPQRLGNEYKVPPVVE